MEERIAQGGFASAVMNGIIHSAGRDCWWTAVPASKFALLGDIDENQEEFTSESAWPVAPD